MLHEIIRIQASDGKLSYVIPTEGGLLFYLGRLFVTGPHLKARYKLDVNFVMDREHINDAKRVIKFLKFYFEKVEVNFWPIWFLRLLSINVMIFGTCSKSRFNIED